MFFGEWTDLTRILVIGILAYAGLILLQRISGKRTLSKMNAFDLIVTVALGSALATVLLSRDVSLVEGLLAFGVLMGLQFLITFMSTHWKSAVRMIKSEPRLILYQGRFLSKALLEERVLESEIRQAVRSAGMASLDDVEAVVLETDGTFSVIGADGKDKSALSDLALPSRQASDHSGES